MTGKRMTRREVIRLLGTSAVAGWPAAGLAGGRLQTAKGPASGPFLQVALIPCPDYGPEALAEAIRTGWRSTRPTPAP